MTFHVRSDIQEEFPTLDYLWHANLRQRRTREAGASKGRTSAGRETFKSLIRTTCSFLLSPENYWPVKPEKRWRLLRRRIVSVPIAPLSSAQLCSAQLSQGRCGHAPLTPGPFLHSYVRAAQRQSRRTHPGKRACAYILPSAVHPRLQETQ